VAPQRQPQPPPPRPPPPPRGRPRAMPPNRRNIVFGARRPCSDILHPTPSPVFARCVPASAHLDQAFCMVSHRPPAVLREQRCGAAHLPLSSGGVGAGVLAAAGAVMFTKATSGGTDEMRELLGTKMGTSCTPFGLSVTLHGAWTTWQNERWVRVVEVGSCFFSLSPSLRHDSRLTACVRERLVACRGKLKWKLQLSSRRTGVDDVQRWTACR